MIIQPIFDQVTGPVSSTYTRSFILSSSNNSTGVYAVLNGTTIYQLSTGQYIFVNGSNKVLLPSIFTPTVMQNIYPKMAAYYILNDMFFGPMNNAVYIDASNNVYLGGAVSGWAVGMQFLAGSTTINKEVYLNLASQASTTSTSFVAVLTYEYYAQHTNPTANIVLSISNSAATASAYVLYDGIQSTTVTTSNTTPTSFNLSFSKIDTGMVKHIVKIFLNTSNSTYTAYTNLVIFG